MLPERVQRQATLALMALSLLFVLLGAGMVALVLLLPPERFQVLIGSAIVAIAGLALKAWLMRRLLRWLSGEGPVVQRPTTQKPFDWRSLLRPEFVQDKDLTQRVNAIAERLGAKVREVKLNVTARFPHATAFNGTVIVSKTLLDLFSPQEQDFLIARALAKSKTDKEWVGATVLTMLGLPFIIGMPILLTHIQPLFSPAGILQSLVALLGLGLISTGLASPISELRQRLIDEEAIDRLTLSATKNLSAAESALRKLAQWEAEARRQGISPRAVPLMEQKIQQELDENLVRLRRIAQALGLSE